MSRKKKARVIEAVEQLKELREKQQESMNAGLLKLSQNFKPPVPPKWSIPTWFVPSIDAISKTPSVDVGKLQSLKEAEPYKVVRPIPDYVHVITAWRAWGVTTDSRGYRLKGLGVDHVWEPKKQVSAACNKTGMSGTLTFTIGAFGAIEPSKPDAHPAPLANCTCGVWAFKELDSLVAAIGSGYDKVRVLGQVSLWGRVVETVNGYRAQYAYPAELWLLDSSLEELGLIYDVPVRRVD